MTFYENLVVAMRVKGVNAAELSRRTGFYESFFSNLKNGNKKDVTWERALKIIEALGMTPSEFAALEEEEDE